MSESIGYIIGGSLRGNLRIRLTGNAEEIQEGSFVVVDSGNLLFYCLVTDLQLGSTDPRFSDEQFESRIDPRLVAMLMGQTLYTNVEVMPVLMQETTPDGQLSAGTEQSHPLPVKTIPEHHALVRLAKENDVANIFGRKEDPGNFHIGNTLDQNALSVCIDLRKFVKRSSGIFGATGTGKSFLTRMILAGLMKDKQASVFVFDMHNEYAADRNDPDQEGGRVIGLKSKFGQQIVTYGLGKGAMINGERIVDLLISQNDIQSEDILLLSKELNLRETTSSTIAALVREHRDNWFPFFMGLVPGKSTVDEEGKKIWTPDSVEGWAESANIHPIAASTLHSRLSKIMDKPYVVADDQQAQKGLQMIVDSLQNGQHVILTFGNYDTDLDYLLVTNILTRRIREVWVKKTEAFNHSAKIEEKPRPLVIAVEEAHKLLTKEMASQTIFSTIAREMRKYSVTLLVIDQRPSQIDDEVMSQLGTRISGWLGDDTDISAVLSGLANKEQLRGMLSHLNEKQEVLLLGWGVPMPLPVRSRTYDQQFWADLMGDSSRDDFNTLTAESFNLMMKKPKARKSEQ